MTDNTAPQESATPWRMAGIVLIALGLYFINLAQTMDGVYLSFGLLVGLGIALAYTPTIPAAQPGSPSAGCGLRALQARKI